MTDHDAVAAALARLATGAAPPAGSMRRTVTGTDQSDDPPPASVVAEADHAYSRLSTAAAFVDDGGEQRLSRAVDDATRAEDHGVADRGRELLASLDRFRAAADRSAEPTGRQHATDHFHCGHATLLTGGGLQPER